MWIESFKHALLALIAGWCIYLICFMFGLVNRHPFSFYIISSLIMGAILLFGLKIIQYKFKAKAPND